MRVPFLVIGGGLSGLAAAIRTARFNPQVLLLEKHSRLGGLNSYFYRNNTLFETGLHAITNYAGPADKSAPLNRLLRQLKLRRKELTFCEQFQSEVVFQGCTSLKFSNNFELFESEINSKFPEADSHFRKLLGFLSDFDPFVPAPFTSAKEFLTGMLRDRLLVDMLLCPLMYYGSSHENDMDLSQFAIMFRAIYQEGMFRPQGSIKDFLDLLIDHYLKLGGSFKKNCGVEKILHHKNKASGVLLKSGDVIECDYILSTIGCDETRRLLDDTATAPSEDQQRLGFVETIYQIPEKSASHLPQKKTIIFYNDGSLFTYKTPESLVDYSSGVICFPGNFRGLDRTDTREIRSTHLANYRQWKTISADREQYKSQKKATSKCSSHCLENIIGSFAENIIFENSFTPVTIERYTSKISGAIYGNPTKIKDGNIGFTNLFLAGTDQGFLGIIGSMLSGVSIVNQHILPKL
ncbi:MAG: FAD-dependent oxidoreductase [Desulforhopalus sp.]